MKVSRLTRRHSRHRGACVKDWLSIGRADGLLGSRIRLFFLQRLSLGGVSGFVFSAPSRTRHTRPCPASPRFIAPFELFGRGYKGGLNLDLQPGHMHRRNRPQRSHILSLYIPFQNATCKAKVSTCSRLEYQGRSYRAQLSLGHGT